MKRLKIVIAGNDITFTMSIVRRFSEQYYSRVDLEIITDELYFAEYFQNSRLLDLLIVDEKLYRASLCKHNIRKTIILTDEDDRTGTGNIIRIYKYSGIKGIFSYLESRECNLLIDNQSELKQSKIIVISSAEGGCGKTSVAVALSGQLAKAHNRVLYIDAEELQTSQLLVDLQIYISSPVILSEIINKPEDSYYALKSEIIRQEFDCIPALISATSAIGVPAQLFVEIAKSAKKSEEYDYIIVDTDHSFTQLKASLLAIADSVVMVMKQTKHSFSAIKRFFSIINDYGEDKYKIVCNECEGVDETYLVDTQFKYKVFGYMDYFGDNENAVSEGLNNCRCISELTEIL